MSKVVVVVAGHRTGSGLTSQLLNMLGVDMGLPEASPALHTDDLGEDQEFVAIHRAMLRERVAEDWQWPKPRITHELSKRWVSLVRQRSSKAIWGFKDPRFVFLADYGLGVLATAGLDVQLVWLHRGAPDVASSLQVRDGTPYLHALSIAAHYETRWATLRERYDGWPGCDIEYNDLVADPLKQVARITESLQLPTGAVRQGKAAGIVRPARF